MVHGRIMGGNRHKLKPGRFRADVRRTVFLMKRVEHWDRLP